MARSVIVIVAMVCVVYAATASADCYWEKYDFGTDPLLDYHVINPDGSINHFFPLEEPMTIPEGCCIAVGFCVEDYNFGSLGHSSLMGPIAVDAPNYFPFVRLNLHYMGSVPEFSIYTTTQGYYYTLTVGACYCANLIRVGETVEVELYVKTGTGADSLVFEDALPCDWATFDRFHVAYDYYGGGHCLWDSVDDEVDCLSNRSTSFIEYSIDYVTVCDVGPTATESRSWGSIKALFE